MRYRRDLEQSNFEDRKGISTTTKAILVVESVAPVEMPFVFLRRIMKNRCKFDKFMKTIIEICEDPKSDFLIECYWEALKPFSDEQCQRGFESVYRKFKSLPKPFEIIDFILADLKPNKGEQAIALANEIIAYHSRFRFALVLPMKGFGSITFQER